MMATDKPLRVLFAIGSMGGGGAERQVIHLLRHLDRREFAPQLYLTLRTGELLADVPADVPITSLQERVPSPRINWPGRRAWQQSIDLAAVMAEQRIDVLCAETFHLAITAKSSVRRRPTPWVAVEMCDPRIDFLRQVTRFRWLKRRLVAQAYCQATRCVAVSEGVRTGISEFFEVLPDNMATIPNCVDLAEIRRLAELPGPTLSSGQLHVATMGRLHEQKGHRFLLDAWRRLIHDEGRRHLHLHLLGQGPREATLRAQTRSLNLDNYVTFCGYVANPFSYLKQCHLFCFPSLYEGLPLALLEAIAVGLPVIATDCPSGPREILDGERGGLLVPPADSAALASAIARSVDDPATIQSKQLIAIERVESEYSVARCVHRYARLFRECAQQTS